MWWLCLRPDGAFILLWYAAAWLSNVQLGTVTRMFVHRVGLGREGELLQKGKEKAASLFSLLRALSYFNRWERQGSAQLKVTSFCCLALVQKAWERARHNNKYVKRGITSSRALELQGLLCKCTKGAGKRLMQSNKNCASNRLGTHQKYFPTKPKPQRRKMRRWGVEKKIPSSSVSSWRPVIFCWVSALVRVWFESG